MPIDFAAAQARLGESMVRTLGNASMVFAGGTVDGYRTRHVADSSGLGIIGAQLRRVGVRLALADVQALGHDVREGTAVAMGDEAMEVAARDDDAEHGWCDLQLRKAQG